MLQRASVAASAAATEALSCQEIHCPRLPGQYGSSSLRLPGVGVLPLRPAQLADCVSLFLKVLHLEVVLTLSQIDISGVGSG